MKKSKSANSLEKLSLFIFFALLLIIGAALVFLYKEQYLNCISDNFTLCINSKKYTSTLGNFSFRYPIDYPISSKLGNELKTLYNSDFNSVEWVNFTNDFYPNAGGDRLGSVIVEKNTSYQDVKDYGDKTLADFEALPEQLKGISPKVRYMEIGGENAVHVKTGAQPSSFAQPSDEYVLIRKDGLYRISFDYNDYYHKLPIQYYEQAKQLVLSTFRFK